MGQDKIVWSGSVKTVGSWDWEKILAGITGLKNPIGDPLTGQEEEKARKPSTSDRLFVIGRNVFCLIRCIYIHFTAPLTIYPARSFPRHERCLSVTYSFFWPFLPSLFQRRILGCVRSNNFESSPYRSSFVIRCYFPLLEYRESGHRSCCVVFILPSVAGPFVFSTREIVISLIWLAVKSCELGFETTASVVKISACIK